jgi:hypothetical protein
MNETPTIRLLGADLDDAELGRVAALHRACLPRTASSRAGAGAVAHLYRALADDADGIVLWSAVPGEDAGGFAAGTIDLRATERRLRARLDLSTALRLGLCHLLAPAHLWSRRRWESAIPRQAIGYVLTLGARRAADGAGPRGSALLDELERRFVARGARESWVDTEASNVRALAFYRRTGYEVQRSDAGQILLRKVLS